MWESALLSHRLWHKMVYTVHLRTIGDSFDQEAEVDIENYSSLQDIHTDTQFRSKSSTE